jgi:hypothetical protein
MCAASHHLHVYCLVVHWRLILQATASGSGVRAVSRVVCDFIPLISLALNPPTTMACSSWDVVVRPFLGWVRSWSGTSSALLIAPHGAVRCGKRPRAKLHECVPWLVPSFRLDGDKVYSLVNFLLSVLAHFSHLLFSSLFYLVSPQLLFCRLLPFLIL